MSNAEILVAGDDYLGLGCDQFSSPQKIEMGKYISSENTICRGGIVQTRPGTATMFRLPDGNLQGMTFFKPSSGTPHLVAAVDGKVYVSPYPFRAYRQLPNLQFSVGGRFIAWASCLKTTDFNSDGELYYLDNPYSVLIIQDGLTRAGYWDGSSSGHLNPEVSPIIDPDTGERITSPGYDGTPLGLWMCWANNRLWVSRGNQIFASDQGNPMKFTEGQYINEGRAFYLPDNCTGISPTTDLQGIVCFTSQNGTFLQSSIQDRTKWLSTPDFQKVILPSTGCVAPRSIVSQYGMLWWYSAKGLINQDDALRANITSRLSVQDNAMLATKAKMCFDLAGICASSYENMLLVSVPYGDKLNRRTLALDQAPMGDNGAMINAWASYWTGWRPVEWAYGIINGEERVFFASKDYDGYNRIWELGTESKTDNDVPITSSLSTKEHLFQNRDNKILNYIEVELCNLKGDVSFMISAAGVRGAWQVIGQKEIAASEGQVYAGSQYGFQAHDFIGFSPQNRTLRSENSIKASDCNSACVESDISGLEDKGFSAMFTWSGIAGINAYRIFCRPAENFYNGNCEDSEVNPNMINDLGCGEKDWFDAKSPFTTYSSTQTFSLINSTSGNRVAATVSSTSIISQADADRKAYLSARAYVYSVI